MDRLILCHVLSCQQINKNNGVIECCESNKYTIDLLLLEVCNKFVKICTLCDKFSNLPQIICSIQTKHIPNLLDDASSEIHLLQVKNFLCLLFSSVFDRWKCFLD